MAKVISIANQKGGVAKTTSAVQLGIGLARKGKKVLFVDADPQGTLTAFLDWDKENLMPLTYTLAEKADDYVSSHTLNKDGIIHCKEGVDLLPTNENLFLVQEYILPKANDPSRVLKRIIDQYKPDYDYIIIDCNPGIGILLKNSLTASDEVIIPLNAQKASKLGLKQLKDTIESIRLDLNENLRINGLVFTMTNDRTNYSKRIVSDIYDEFGNRIKIYDTHIPFSVKVQECTDKGISIYEYAPGTPSERAYESFVEEFISSEKEDA